MKNAKRQKAMGKKVKDKMANLLFCLFAKNII